jgi:hypothetical protein
MDLYAASGLVSLGSTSAVKPFYIYTASGGLKLKKCGIGMEFLPLHIHETVFGVGDEAWLKYKAQKGKIQSVYIKKVKIISDALFQGRGHCDVIYFDTLNSAYNEDELITNSEAIAIATAYIENRLKQAARACSL